MNPLKKPINKNPALTNVPPPYCSSTFPCVPWKQLSHISCVVLSGFTGRKSYLMSVICKTMRDLHLLSAKEATTAVCISHFSPG